MLKHIYPDTHTTPRLHSASSAGKMVHQVRNPSGSAAHATTHATRRDTPSRHWNGKGVCKGKRHTLMSPDVHTWCR